MKRSIQDHKQLADVYYRHQILMESNERSDDNLYSI